MKYSRPHTHHLTVGIHATLRQTEKLMNKIGKSHSDEDWRDVYEKLKQAKYHLTDAAIAVKMIAEFNAELRSKLK